MQFNTHIQAYSRQQARISSDDLKQKYGLETIYQMSQNENPLGPSPKAIEAIQTVLPDLSYYPSFSDIELRQAIVNTLGQGLEPDNIYTGCSGYESIELLTRGLLNEGDECIISSPTFSIAYQKLTAVQGAKLVDVPLKQPDFTYDVQGVLAAITPQTKIIMLCNPNNPTGTIMTATEMDELMQNVPPHVLVVSDEVYHHFVQNPEYPNSVPYVLDGANLLIIHSFSKAYGLAGLRLGYGIARPELANYLSGLHRGFHQNKIALAAGIAAANDEEYLQHVVAYINEQKAWLFAELERLNITFWRGEGNFILFETPIPMQELYEGLLQRGIISRPQNPSELPNMIRISVGTVEANQAFIAALGDILG